MGNGRAQGQEGTLPQWRGWIYSEEMCCNERQNIIEDNECMMGLKNLIDMREEERCLPNLVMKFSLISRKSFLNQRLVP